MIYTWCVECGGRTCFNENSHRASRSIQYRADFMLGGRNGSRIRKLFANKKDAEAYEYVTKADFARGEFLPDKSKITFKELADQYYREHCLNLNVNPHSSTQYRIKQVKEIFGNQLAASISRKQIKELRFKLQEKGDKNSSINRLVNGVIKPIFNKAIENELIKENPCDHLPKLQEDEPIPRFLTVDEIKKLYSVIKEPHLRDYADIIHHTGARPSSIKLCSFDSGDVDFPNRTIWFTTFKGRRRHRYAVPMDSVVHEIVLRRMVETGGKGLVFNRYMLKTLIPKAIKESKINEGRTKERRFTIYGLKHCLASRLIMSGSSLYDVQKLFGHTDSKMIQKHYAHIEMEYLRRKQENANLTPSVPLE